MDMMLTDAQNVWMLNKNKKGDLKMRRYVSLRTMAFKSIGEIKKAVNEGKSVFKGNEAYQVIKDSKGQWLIYCHLNGYCVGLTWSISADTYRKHYGKEIDSRYHFVDLNGQVLNGTLDEFFIGGEKE
jgi:hypothetical protein